MDVNVPEFHLTLSQIALVNLRWEFRDHLALLRDPGFREKFVGEIRPVETPYLVWYGMPDDLLTLLLQRAISGFESYVAAAVYIESGRRGLLDKELMDKLRNPFTFGGRSLPENILNRMPAAVHSSFSLREADPDLWATSRLFYSKVRNPLFHGYQVGHGSADGVLAAFEFIARLHYWVDTWFNLDELSADKAEPTGK